MEQYSSARVSAPAPVQVCGREYDNLAHSCNALRRASARPLPRHERLQNRGINAFQRCMYTLDCIRNKPSALSHSDVHLLTHDVQLPAMMCNYTFYTYKINALRFPPSSPSSSFLLFSLSPFFLLPPSFLLPLFLFSLFLLFFFFPFSFLFLFFFSLSSFLFLFFFSLSSFSLSLSLSSLSSLSSRFSLISV